MKSIKTRIETEIKHSHLCVSRQLQIYQRMVQQVTNYVCNPTLRLQRRESALAHSAKHMWTIAEGMWHSVTNAERQCCFRHSIVCVKNPMTSCLMD